MREVLGSVRRVRFTQSTLRQASIRKHRGSSFGKIQVKKTHQQSPYAMKLEDRSPGETASVQSYAPEARYGILPRMFSSSKKRRKLRSARPQKNGHYWRRQQSLRKESGRL